MKLYRRVMAATVMSSLLVTSMPMSAYAGMISTETAVSDVASTADRAKVEQFLNRDDIRQALQDHGVSYDSAKSRVDAMSDNEVAQLAQRVDEAPAGGDVLGIAFTVFIILLITDILGLTKVFPFTRSVR